MVHEHLGCPNCGGKLLPVTLGGPHPPWQCVPCKRAWWEAELHPEHRVLWRKETQDHGVHGEKRKNLEQARTVERDESIRRKHREKLGE